LPVLVMISSISVPICNHFHAKQANSGQITAFLQGYPSLAPVSTSILEPRGSGLKLLEFKFNAEYFICRLSWSISSHFSAIQSWNSVTARNRKKNSL